MQQQRIVNLIRLHITVLLLILGYNCCCAQTDSGLIYDNGGEGCPPCIGNHPEAKYEFKIECSGCEWSDILEQNNLRTTIILDRKYENRWTENYMDHYCDSTLYFSERTLKKNKEVEPNIISYDETYLQYITNKIDSICKAIDNNKTLGEGIREGAYINKKGGWDRYDLKSKNGDTLYRIRHNSSKDLYSRTTYYYKNKTVIKAIITIEDWNSGSRAMKKVYSATYYFDNNILIEAIDENTLYSNAADILKQGLTFQEEFYKDK